MTEDPPVATLLPERFRVSLVFAARARDLKLVDTLTDELVRIGICRPREECRLLPYLVPRGIR